MPTFKRWGEGKNSEKGMIRKSRRTREKVMSREDKGGILGVFLRYGQKYQIQECVVTSKTYTCISIRETY